MRHTPTQCAFARCSGHAVVCCIEKDVHKASLVLRYLPAVRRRSVGCTRAALSKASPAVLSACAAGGCWPSGGRSRKLEGGGESHAGVPAPRACQHRGRACRMTSAQQRHAPGRGIAARRTQFPGPRLGPSTPRRSPSSVVSVSSARIRKFAVQRPGDNPGRARPSYRFHRFFLVAALLLPAIGS